MYLADENLKTNKYGRLVVERLLAKIENTAEID